MNRTSQPTNTIARLVAAAAVAASSFSWLGCNREEQTTGTTTTTDTRTPGEKVGDAVQHGVDATTRGASKAADAVARGVEATTRNVSEAATQAAGIVSPTGATDLKGARNAIAGVVNNALDPNNFNSMAGYLTESDAKRLKATKADTKDLDTQIDAFRKQWKDKYGEAFKVSDADAVYTPSFLAINQTSTDDRSAATATVAASHGLPELVVRLVAEGGLWKIDTDDSIDGNTAVANLKSALTDLSDTSKWPADKNDAYRHATHRVLMAVLNKT